MNSFNGHLKEKVFMLQPQVFEHFDLPYHVCKLKNAIYGLKQVLHAWHTKLWQVPRPKPGSMDPGRRQTTINLQGQSQIDI